MVARAILVIVLSLAQTSASLADYIGNYSRWRDMTKQAQGLYAMGLYDGVGIVWQDDNFSLSFGLGLRTCGQELRLTGPMLAEAITGYYEKHTGRWGYPASTVFMQAVGQGVCLQHINAERAKVGLEPWPRQDYPTGALRAAKACARLRLTRIEIPDGLVPRREVNRGSHRLASCLLERRFYSPLIFNENGADRAAINCFLSRRAVEQPEKAKGAESAAD